LAPKSQITLPNQSRIPSDFFSKEKVSTRECAGEREIMGNANTVACESRIEKEDVCAEIQSLRTLSKDNLIE
jgi:hypothetical protein